MGLRETQRLFSKIPYGTLQRHVKLGSGTIVKPGRRPFLEEEVELALVAAIEKLAEVGYGLTRKEV